MAEDSGGGSADVAGVVVVGERRVEGTEGALAAFVVFERDERVDPRCDGGVLQLCDGFEEVLFQRRGEFGDVLINVEERGDEFALLRSDGRERATLLEGFPEHDAS